MLGSSPAYSGFAVDDVPAARAFYSEVLGVSVSEANGMLTLHLPGRDVLVYPKPGHEPAGFTVLNFPVPDIEAAVDALVARGVAIIQYDWTDERGINRQGGPLIAWFTDPAGNVLSVLEDAGPDDETRIRDLIAHRTRDQDTKDAAGVVSHYAADAVLYDLAPPLAQAATGGPDGFRARLDDWFDGFVGEMTFTVRDLEVTVSGDVAFAHGLTSVTATPAGAPSAFTLWFRTTFGLRRTDGSWAIAHEHKSVPFHMQPVPTETGGTGFRAATDLEP